MVLMQKAALAIGKTGCYFLSIIYLAYDALSHYFNDPSISRMAETVSVFKLFDDAVKNKWCDEQCFMLRPDLLVKALLDPNVKSVSVRYEALSYIPKKNEYEITRYEKGSWAHFVCTKDGKVVYDPYGYDVKDLGKPVSKRIFTIVF